MLFVHCCSDTGKILGTTIKKFLNNLSKDFGKELVARQFAEGIESLDPKIAGELLKAYKSNDQIGVLLFLADNRFGRNFPCRF